MAAHARHSVSRRKRASTACDECGPTTVVFRTRLDWMAVAFRDELLVGVAFGHATRDCARAALERCVSASPGSMRPVDEACLDWLAPAASDLVERLKQYSAGAAVDFSDVKVDVAHLTMFGRRVVEACRRIKRGTTRSYGELAADGGSPGAARAVGQLMARNRYPLVVPCHRVLASGGSLGGFSAPKGLAMKRRLLALEGYGQA